MCGPLFMLDEISLSSVIRYFDDPRLGMDTASWPRHFHRINAMLFASRNDSTRIAGRHLRMFAFAALYLCLYACLSFSVKASEEDKPVESLSAEHPDGYVFHQHFSYYPVAGDDATAMRRSLNSQGPIGTDGKRYGGYTQWSIHWDYVSRSDASGNCSVVSFHTALDVEMTLPQWEPSTDVPALLWQQWSNYLAALREHEDGHVQNAERGAIAIEQLMQTMRPQSDCDLLDQNLQAEGQQILQRFKENDIDYDQRTEHGRTQGAVFP